MTESQVTIPNKQEIIRNPDGTYPKGVSGNPAGRPKGKTIKERVIEWLEEHPEDQTAFIEHFVKKDRALAWQMLEGRPQQDITSGGEKIIPNPIYGGQSIQIPEHHGDPKDIQTQKENPSGGGGN